MNEDANGDPLRPFAEAVETLWNEEFRGNAGEDYEIFASRFSKRCDDLLGVLSPGLFDEAIRLAKGRGYIPPNERWSGFDTPVCPLTGIDPHCCHCGRHP